MEMGPICLCYCDRIKCYWSASHMHWDAKSVGQINDLQIQEIHWKPKKRLVTFISMKNLAEDPRKNLGKIYTKCRQGNVEG